MGDRLLGQTVYNQRGHPQPRSRRGSVEDIQEDFRQEVPIFLYRSFYSCYVTGGREYL
jgi:hypothetical protein